MKENGFEVFTIKCVKLLMISTVRCGYWDLSSLIQQERLTHKNKCQLKDLPNMQQKRKKGGGEHEKFE